MERLTKRLEDGQVVFHECHGTCGTCDGATCYCIGTMVDRLAAYEETGMEPGDFKKAFNENAILKLAAQALSTTPDHLRDLLQAEQDGRLVVLPCKVGDTVYWLHNDVITECRVHRVQMNRTGLFICLKSKVSHGAFRVDICLGKTVFLTREEAEAALAQEGGEG